MTILEALEEVSNGLSRSVTFFYADLNEANFSIDQLVNSDLPVLIILPFTVVDVRSKSGILKSSFELQAFMLDKDIDQITTDYKAKDVENKVIAPMRMLAREFIFKLTEHSIVDPETAGITQATFQPIYSELDANLYGVFIRAQVPVMEGLTGCVH